MEKTISLSRIGEKRRFGNAYVADTTFVLFFLAMDLGRGVETLGVNELISIFTLVTFIGLPYLLPFAIEKPSFVWWVCGRIFIAAIGLIAGSAIGLLMYDNFIQYFKYFPMTMLIVAGIFCAATQIRGIIRVRLAS